MGYLSIAFAYVYGFFFFDEIPHWSGLVGMALIVCASACILYFQWSARRLQKERAAAAARLASASQMELGLVTDGDDSITATAAIMETGREDVGKGRF